MHVTLEVGTGALLRELAEGRTDDVFDAALAATEAEAQTTDEDFVTLFADAVEAERPGTRLARYFRNPTPRSAPAPRTTRSRRTSAPRSTEALVRAVEIIRQRVDRFGVTEPLDPAAGLAAGSWSSSPAWTTPERVRDLLSGTAKLDVPPDADATDEVQQRPPRSQLLRPGPAGRDGRHGRDRPRTARPRATRRPRRRRRRPALDVGAASTGATPAAGAATGRPPSCRDVPADPASPTRPSSGSRRPADTAEVRRSLPRPARRRSCRPGVRLLYTARPDGRRPRTARRSTTSSPSTTASSSTGDVITDADPDFDPYTNAPQVSLAMNSDGASRWRQITTANIDKPVAIVLDDVVYTYPTINGPSRTAGPRSRALYAPGGRRHRDGPQVGRAPGAGQHRRRSGRSGRAWAPRLDPGRHARAARRASCWCACSWSSTTAPPASSPTWRSCSTCCSSSASWPAFHATLTLPGIAGIVLTHRHGRRRQRAHLRAHPRGDGLGQDDARRRRRRLRQGALGHRRRQHHHVPDRRHPVLVRRRPDPGLRRHAHGRHPDVALHGPRRHAPHRRLPRPATAASTSPSAMDLERGKVGVSGCAPGLHPTPAPSRHSNLSQP